MLNELVIPAVRDGGAFTSVRGFQGIPQRDIHFTATFVRSYAQEFEKLDRLRQQVEAGKITLRVAEVYPPERAADAIVGWRLVVREDGWSSNSDRGKSRRSGARRRARASDWHTPSKPDGPNKSNVTAKSGLGI